MSFKPTREASGSVCAVLRWSQADGWSEDLTFNNAKWTQTWEGGRVVIRFVCTAVSEV